MRFRALSTGSAGGLELVAVPVPGAWRIRVRTCPCGRDFAAKTRSANAVHAPWPKPKGTSRSSQMSSALSVVASIRSVPTGTHRAVRTLEDDVDTAQRSLRRVEQGKGERGKSAGWPRHIPRWARGSERSASTMRPRFSKISGTRWTPFWLLIRVDQKFPENVDRVAALCEVVRPRTKPSSTGRRRDGCSALWRPGNEHRIRRRQW